MNHSQSRATAFTLIELPAARRRGFTLIELMISIAIVLILMLGINFVFGMTSRTVSTGMALSQVGRDIRNMRKIYDQDFGNMVSADEMPALVIQNETVDAWRDKQDKLADAEGNPTTYDADSTAGDEIDLGPLTGPSAQYKGLYNFRRHRIDRLSFFMRNGDVDYTRQTGDDTTYVGPEISSEAWVSYGLLRQAGNHPTIPARNGITYWKPGARGPANGDERYNPDNLFSTQWMLGRRLIVMKDPTSFPANSPARAYVATANNVPLYFGTAAKNATGTVTLNHDGAKYTAASANSISWKIQESRVDLAAGTILGAHDGLAALGGPTANWAVDADANQDFLDFSVAAQNTLNYLSWAKPYVDKALFANSINDQTRETALTTPIFVRGCTQFIVEFAGDFYDQGPLATTTPPIPEPLGTVDYDVIGTGVRTHWYGSPRDVDGDGVVDIEPVIIPPTKGIDGVTTPARRFAVNTGLGPKQPAFEQTVYSNTTTSAAKPMTPMIWAWGPKTAGGDPIVGTVTGTVVNPGTPATGAFNVRPSLIRITMELIDANGRLQDGQRIEFVYHVK